MKPIAQRQVPPIEEIIEKSRKVLVLKPMIAKYDSLYSCIDSMQGNPSCALKKEFEELQEFFRRTYIFSHILYEITENPTQQ